VEGQKCGHVLVYMACFEKLEEKHHFKGAKGWRFEGPHLPSFESHHAQVH